MFAEIWLSPCFFFFDRDQWYFCIWPLRDCEVLDFLLQKWQKYFRPSICFSTCSFRCPLWMEVYSHFRQVKTMSGRRLYNVSTILAVSSVTSCLVLSLLLLLYGPLTFFNEWSVSETLGFISNVSFCKILGFISWLVVWSLNLNISGFLLKVAFISNLSGPSNVAKVSSTFESEIPFNCRSSAIARKLSMLDWNAHCLLFDNFSSNSKHINIQTKLPAGPLPRQSIWSPPQPLGLCPLPPSWRLLGQLAS